MGAGTESAAFLQLSVLFLFPHRFAGTHMPYAEALDLITRFPDTKSLARHIADRLIADPDSEEHWRAIALACDQLAQATLQ